MPDPVKPNEVDPNEDPEKFIKDLIDQKLEEKLKASGKVADKEEAPGITATVKGQTLKFKDEAELAAFLTQVSDASLSLQEQLKAAKTTQDTSQTSNRETTGLESPKFDPNEYVKLLGEDPLKAQGYALDAALGVEGSLDALKQGLVEVALMKRQMATFQFLQAHKDFKGGKDSDVMYDIITKMNWPYSYESLEAAHALAVQNNLITYEKRGRNNQGDEENVVDINEGRPQVSRVKAPPSIPKTGAVDGGEVFDDAEDLSIEELASIINKAHAAGHR